MKRIFLATAVAWFVVSLALAVWWFVARGSASATTTSEYPSPAAHGPSDTLDEEHSRLVYRYYPEKLSQHWEEMLMRDYFGDMRGGFFIDVGSNHYQIRNTTYYLEKALGWEGIAIDALAEVAKGYAEHRPRTTFVAAYVGETSDEKVEFFVVPRNTRLSTGNAALGNQLAADLGAEKRVIPTVTLTDILDAHQVRTIDLLKMDIELAEPAALRGFDIDRFRPSLVVVEYHDQVRDEIEAYMESHGYVQLQKYMRWDPNGWFVPREDLAAFLERWK